MGLLILVMLVLAVMIALLPQLFSLPQYLSLLLRRQMLDLISVIVNVIECLLIVANRRPWRMLIITIAITAVRTAVIDRPRVIPIGRPGIRGVTVSIAIIDGWRISIPIAIIHSGHAGVAVIAATS
jgi:hypothetical protein